MITTGKRTLTKKQEEVHGIISKIMEGMIEGKDKGENLGETFKYVMEPEEFADLLSRIEFSGIELAKHIGNKDEAQRLVMMACLLVGYHLGTNKMKEVS